MNKTRAARWVELEDNDSPAVLVSRVLDLQDELDAAYAAMDATRDRVAALERVAGEVPRLTYGKPAWVREGDHEFLLVRVSADQYAALLAALDAVAAGDTTTGEA